MRKKSLLLLVCLFTLLAQPAHAERRVTLIAPLAAAASTARPAAWAAAGGAES